MFPMMQFFLQNSSKLNHLDLDKKKHFRADYKSRVTLLDGFQPILAFFPDFFFLVPGPLCWIHQRSLVFVKVVAWLSDRKAVVFN